MAKKLKKTNKTAKKSAVKAKKQLKKTVVKGKKPAKKTAAVKTAVKKGVKPIKKTAIKKTGKKAVKKVVKKPVTKVVKKPVIAPAKTLKAKKPVVVKKMLKKHGKKNKSRYTIRELLHFKNILMDEKKTILESARANMMSLVDKESGDYVGDDLSYASHMAEQGTDEMEREKNYMFVQRDEKYLGYIEEALTRIDNGTYGICIDCIDVPKNLCKTCPLIPRERLEIVPITQHCIECKNLRG
jgi:DnaK suppressor protein